RDPIDEPDLDRAVLEKVLLTNTVPFKPAGNMPYPVRVREQLRPFLERLLVDYWLGDRVITLGNEALRWFVRYAPEVKEYLHRSDRYRARLEIPLRSGSTVGSSRLKVVTVRPLPHPSSRNQRYRAQFPELLRQRLAEVRL